MVFSGKLQGCFASLRLSLRAVSKVESALSMTAGDCVRELLKEEFSGFWN
jgi:hypothetical protein